MQRAGVHVAPDDAMAFQSRRLERGSRQSYSLWRVTIWETPMARPVLQLAANLCCQRSKLSLRRAGADDSAFAYRAKKAAFRQYVEQAWGWNEDEQLELHRARYQDQDIRIINAAGADVGMMALAVTRECIKVNQIFLLPEHQGRRIGERCMSLICDEARRLGLPVRLRVMKVNPRAQAFYRRLGYADIGTTKTHVIMELSP